MYIHYTGWPPTKKTKTKTDSQCGPNLTSLVIPGDRVTF